VLYCDIIKHTSLHTKLNSIELAWNMTEIGSNIGEEVVGIG